MEDEDGDIDLQRKVFYGQFHYALVVGIPAGTYGVTVLEAPKPFVFACVTPCTTDSKDATRELTSYTDSGPEGFIDVTCIECCVGRIQKDGRWYIVDRSAGVARTTFVAGDSDSDVD
jgi:hypothetical protein